MWHLQETQKQHEEQSEAHQLREAQRNPQAAVKRFLREDPISRNAAEAAAAASVLIGEVEESEITSAAGAGRHSPGKVALAQEQIAAALRGEWPGNSIEAEKGAVQERTDTADVAPSRSAQRVGDVQGLEQSQAEAVSTSAKSYGAQPQPADGDIPHIAALAGIRKFLEEDLGMKPNRATAVIRAAVKGDATMEDLDSELAHTADVPSAGSKLHSRHMGQPDAPGDVEIMAKWGSPAAGGSAKEQWLQARRSAVILKLAGAAPDTIEGLVRKHEKDIDDGLLEMLHQRIKAARRFDEVSPLQ
jgi:hypothetical protein